MQTIEFPRYTASQPSYCMPPVANAISRGADNPIESGFLVTLLAMAGHDLRQPLQVIMSAHDVLETMLRDKKQQEELARAGDATGQLARMLSQLIDALQLQEPPREDLRAPVLLWPVLDDLVAEFGYPARLKGITFRVTTARGTALSHPVLLTSILRNLVRNAIEYTPRGGRVFVASHRCGPELRIEVRDTGAGIGHRVEVQSVEGRGSRFTVVARAASYDTSKPSPIWSSPSPRPSASLSSARRNASKIVPKAPARMFIVKRAADMLERHSVRPLAMPPLQSCDDSPRPRAGWPYNGGVLR
jgi:hypothetical protein